MARFRCLDCEHEIVEPEEKVNRNGGYRCQGCGMNGEWVRV